jgi:hypothetical protein
MNKHEIPDDMKDLVLTEEQRTALMETASKSSAPKKRRTRSKFIILPDAWDYQLARIKADGCTYRVAIDLLRQAWRSQSNHVKLANIALKGRNVSRWSKYRALDRLAAAGLISTKREPRKSPVVTVKFTD